MTNPNVSQLMQHPVQEIDPDAEVQFVSGLARTLGVHYFPLVRGGSLIGVVCTCDLDEAKPNTRVLEIANREVLTVARDSKVRDAVAAMLKRMVGSAVVMQGTYVCGLLTREDVIRGDPQLAALFSEQRCDACDTTEHLRHWAPDMLLCASCATRARANAQLDLGGGD